MTDDITSRRSRRKGAGGEHDPVELAAMFALIDQESDEARALEAAKSRARRRGPRNPWARRRQSATNDPDNPDT